MKELKPYRNKLILTCFLTCLPLFIGLLLWDRLPEQMATHFGADNVANGWSSKPFTVIGMPLLLTALHLFTILITLNDPKKKNIGGKIFSFIFWIIPAVSLICCLSTYAYALGLPVNIGLIVNLMLGIVFIVLGNYMSKNHQNYTIGIRLPWTLDSSENWNRTHRLASVLWVLAGIAILANSFFQSTAVLFLVIIAASVIPAVYSFILHTKGI